jgi:hypothetical protein|tara:strand:- start:4766 stop:4882 length:117 start_codon:yes stop_codon:yes gene_type:complete
MDKKAIMGVVFTAIGVASGVLIANMVTEKLLKKGTPSV